ncbi:MAG: carbohydrate binding family 9 domain-containing protein [Candidatus Aminicenantes bacterium]|nr:carbohydrate binding family 9 domain-containing protein [Candidatus Aminicenantes bacterium]
MKKSRPGGRSQIAKRALRALLSVLFLAAFLPAAGVKAVRVATGPEIDGRLDDPVWAEASATADFRMVEPTPGAEPTEKTEMRIVYDEAALYIGILCRDREPGRITANTMAHDEGGSASGGHGYYHFDSASPSDDQVVILLDPFQDKRTAYVFFVNARGARGEGLVYAGSASLNWDGIWDAASRIGEDGWSAEFRIPFKSISFKPGLTVWGLNVERYIPRKMETIRLSGISRDSNFNNPGESAPLEGIENIRQGRGITFRPYGLTGIEKNHSAGTAADFRMDGGLDIYKSFTPNLVGVVSVNMDFAETEVDERMINLTRFPIFFPEKRMFFLEGSEPFSFSSSVSFTPFFSRTIGLVNGEQIPVLFGTKLYGKIGNTNLSLLNVQTGASEGQSGHNMLAARMTQNVFAQSKVGWIFTNGSPTGERNSMIGADFNYSSSTFLGDKNVMLAAWGVYNWNEEKEGRRHGFGFRANYPNDLWNVQSTYAWYGDALNPGLGFIPRNGIQTGYLNMSFQPRPAGGFLGGIIRQVYFNASADYYWDLSGNLETRTLTLSPFGFQAESGESFSFNIQSVRDVLPYDFEVAEGVVLPAGPYDYTSEQVSFSTSARRPVSLSVHYNFGPFYSGRYDNFQASLAVKVDGFVNLSFNTNIVRGRMAQGDFNENVYQVKADVYLSPDFGLMNYIQYDDVSRLLGWSSRLRWRISAGNEIYLVYNKNWERRWDPTSRFWPAEERGVLKLSLSIRP